MDERRVRADERRVGADELRVGADERRPTVMDECRPTETERTWFEPGGKGFPLQSPPL